MLPSALLPVWQPSRRSASGEPRATWRGHLLHSAPRSEVPALALLLGSELQNADSIQEHGATVSGLPPPQGLQGLWNSDGSQGQAECCLDSEMKGSVPCF